MTLLALDAIQQALYNKLTGDGVLMGMISGVYDVPPQAAALPYVVIGDGQSRELPQVVSLISECEIGIQAWTRASGRKTMLAMLNRMYGLLHQTTLIVTGFTVLGMHCKQAETLVNVQQDRVEGNLQLVITVTELG